MGHGIGYLVNGRGLQPLKYRVPVRPVIDQLWLVTGQIVNELKAHGPLKWNSGSELPEKRRDFIEAFERVEWRNTEFILCVCVLVY